MSQTLITVLTSSGAVGLIIGLVNAVMQRKKTSADVVHVLQSAAGGLVKDLRADNTELREEVDRFREALASVTTRMESLQNEMGRKDSELGRMRSEVSDLHERVRGRDHEVARLEGEVGELLDYSVALRDEVMRLSPDSPLPEPPRRVRRFIEGRA